MSLEELRKLEAGQASPMMPDLAIAPTRQVIELSKEQVAEIEAVVAAFQEKLIQKLEISNEEELNYISKVVLLFRHRRNCKQNFVKAKVAKTSKAKPERKPKNPEKPTKLTKNNILDFLDF